MSISEALLPEFDREMENTRKTLERVPADKLGWKPHAKSFTMGELATHVTELPMWGKETLEKDSVDIAPVGAPPYQRVVPKTAAEIVQAFDRHAAAARAALVASSDADFMKPWTLMKGGQPLFTMPKVAVYRGFVMNHMIHHRAQLTVYLRLTDVPVPALYGPSADENPM